MHDDPLLIEHKDGATAPSPILAQDVVAPGDLKLGIAGQGEGTATQGLTKAGVGLQVVGADRDNLSTRRLDGGVLLSQRGDLLGSTGGMVLNVEGEDHFLAAQVLKPQLPVRRGKREKRSHLSHPWQSCPPSRARTSPPGGHRSRTSTQGRPGPRVLPAHGPGPGPLPAHPQRLSLRSRTRRSASHRSRAALQ